MAFKQVIKEVDNVDSNDNDLVYRSGVKFEYSSTENYNSKIMEFLNYIITLPNAEIVFSEKEHKYSLTLEECFHRDVQSFFQTGHLEKFDQLEDMESMLQSKRSIRESPEKNQSEMSFNTHRKLSKNIEPFKTLLTIF